MTSKKDSLEKLLDWRKAK